MISLLILFHFNLFSLPLSGIHTLNNMFANVECKYRFTKDQDQVLAFFLLCPPFKFPFYVDKVRHDLQAECKQKEINIFEIDNMRCMYIVHVCVYVCLSACGVTS